jgi:predicted TIM-barrel fold metal-dependent hydrolase
MIIDCHAHAYMFPKILPTPFSRTTFLSVEEQIAVMDENGIDKAVILSLNGAECPAENQSIGEVLEMSANYPGRFIPFCNIDPRLPKRPDLIKLEDFLFPLEQYKALGCKGLGEVISRVSWQDPSMLLLMEACQKVNFPVTFHTITENFDGYGVIDNLGLHGLENILQRFPDLKLLGHSTAFWNEISSDITEESKHRYPASKVIPGGRLIELMRKYHNLYGDISAESGLLALSRDPEHAFRFIEEFQDRLLLGLDICSRNQEVKHIRWLTDAKSNGQISSRAFDNIMYGNISRILNL